MRIALCEAGVITPERDAGSRAVADLLDGFRALGHDTRMFAEVEPDLPARVAAFAPDIIVISRPGLFVRLHPQLAGLGARVIYLAHDLHFVRVGLQSGYVPETDARAASVMRFVERECFAAADLSLVPTREEAERVATEFPGSRCVAVDYFAMPEQPKPAGPPPGFRLAFVGGSNHAPNRDGVAWFLDEVWPDIRAAHPGAEFVVAGRWDASSVRLARLAGVSFLGELPDAELDAVLAGSRIGIAPLRFGAGMKRKTLHYLSHGLPVIGTEFAAEGLGDVHGDVPGMLRATTPAEWIAAVDRLADDAEWRSRSDAGIGFVRGRFSVEAYRAGLAGVLALLQ